MSNPSRSLLAAVPAAVVLAHSPVAGAAITGFGDFSGFTINQAPFDHASGPTFPSDGSIRLTGTTGGQSRNIFCATPQDVSQFNAAFKYRATPRSMNGATIGVALVLQSVGGGIEGVFGSPGVSLGYAGNASFAHSMAVPLQFNESSGVSSTGRYFDGVAGGGLDSVAPVNLFSGNWISATVAYSGSILAVTLKDTVTNQAYTNSYFVGSLTSRLNGSTGFIGFTAATGTGFGDGADQFITDFTYAVPSAPSMAVFTVCGGAMLRRRR